MLESRFEYVHDTVECIQHPQVAFRSYFGLGSLVHPYFHASSQVPGQALSYYGDWPVLACS